MGGEKKNCWLRVEYSLIIFETTFLEIASIFLEMDLDRLSRSNCSTIGTPFEFSKQKKKLPGLTLVIKLDGLYRNKMNDLLGEETEPKIKKR